MQVVTFDICLRYVLHHATHLFAVERDAYTGRVSIVKLRQCESLKMRIKPYSSSEAFAERLIDIRKTYKYACNFHFSFVFLLLLISTTYQNLLDLSDVMSKSVKIVLPFIYYPENKKN